MRNKDSKDLYINEDIITGAGLPRSKNIRLVGDEGEQLGIMSFANALDTAYNNSLDLVLIAPQAEPPVCKIMDYGKYCFERDKKEKEAKKKQQRIEVKEVQLTVRIDVNDFNTKLNNAIRFLKSGNKVKVMLKFRGRQLSHIDLGKDLLKRFEEGCMEFGSIDKAAALEGRNMIMFISPIKN